MRIVIVDDSLSVQKSLARLLGSVAGLEVVGCARDVIDAVNLIDAAQPDVVVLDVNLLDGDKGIDVLRYVKRQRPRIAVVALSDFPSPKLRQSYLDAGADAFYGKSTEFMRATDWIAGMIAGTIRADAAPRADLASPAPPH
ncbi:response regulator transcription factor [Rhizobacter sp. Root404]|jgi:DNA-binding NarL/FixJ family response regulator|uniref:response regulator n=1 Tax=Rhizobacter sp. Root404 TaxID=1736528 RepID=UPI0006F3900D|nr:response regulator [Rhizobacter sp. Root404]KQW37657.1 hypothetical protein ASC76_05995 [Rhizobacter sp. Root404]